MATKFELSDANKAALKEFGVGLLVVVGDAALVYARDNINKIDFGSWNPMVVSMAGVIIGQLRNLLHGGPVSDVTFMEAIQPKTVEEDKE